MKFMLLSVIFVLLGFLCFMTNPISMGLLLIFYSFLVSFFIGSAMLTSWFCIITILVMVGGLLVIFMYISSISSNEKFKFNLFLFYLFCCLFFFYFDEMVLENQTFDSLEMNGGIDLSESYSMVKLYNNSCKMLTVFMIIYLIFTMIVVSFVVKHFKGPLRSSTYE
uniref:NADH dehydrogenase subunit 6 n=1 Tax=Tituria pyramidata TaxID=2713555 RepID=A0A6G6D498_9HEMI|nr:NADH dehydrogenase subunit 6 [Tituria pyramidata]QIE11353.1 NADH dehydrogenase subunit 6 [Tituria pyramidata]